MTETTTVLDVHAFDQYREFWGEDAGPVIQELVTMFLDNTPEQLAHLEQAYAEGDLATVRRLAHTLKSSSGSVGARALADLFREVETLAEQGDAAGVGQRLAALRDVWEATRAALNAFLQTLPA